MELLTKEEKSSQNSLKQELRPKIKQHQRFIRTCVRCGRDFRPTGKYVKLCKICNKSSNKRKSSKFRNNYLIINKEKRKVYKD